MVHGLVFMGKVLRIEAIHTDKKQYLPKPITFVECCSNSAHILT